MNEAFEIQIDLFISLCKIQSSILNDYTGTYPLVDFYILSLFKVKLDIREHARNLELTF